MKRIFILSVFLFHYLPNPKAQENPPLSWRLLLLDPRIASVAGKVTLTPEVLQKLEAERANVAIFHLISNQTLLLGPTRLANYDSYFRQAATKCLAPVDGVSPNENEWLVSWLKAMALVESGGNPKAKSPANCVGVMQLMAGEKGTAARFGLSPRDYYNPEKNILAGARYFMYLYQLFGEKKCLATASYHMGQGNMYKIIRLGLKEFYGIDTVVNQKNSASLVASFNISYSLLYFAAKPNGELYNKVSGLKDQSMSYYWKVVAAERLLPLDSARFDSAYKQVVRSQEKPFRFFTWCLEQELAEEEVVILPFSSRRLYSFLKWSEPPPEDDFFGEKFRICREAAGAAIAIGALYRELTEKQNVPFGPIAVENGDNAPEYCRDFAFTLYAPSNAEAASLFHFTLKRLANLGFIAYKEDGMSYLVVVAPEKEKKKVLEDIYLEAKKYYDEP